MSSVLPANKFSYGATLLNENVLKDDLTTYALAQSIERAVVNHLVYYLREYFSDVIIKYSDTSAGTTVEFAGKYPEDIANEHYPRVIVYVPSKNIRQIFMGDVIFDTKGELYKARNGVFEVMYDVWGRTQTEVEAITGILLRLLDDMNHDSAMLSRGFSNFVYSTTLGREFDITDKIVQTVSHLDSSINIRREQIVFKADFFYRIAMPKAPAPDGYVSTFSYDIVLLNEDDSTITTIAIVPRNKVFSQQTLITAN